MKPKKGKCPKVKLDQKSAKGNGDKKSIKPKKEPINNQLNTNENSLKPKVNDEELEIKPKTEVKGETKPKTELTDEEREAIENEKAFKEVNKWKDPSYADLTDQPNMHKDPVD